MRGGVSLDDAGGEAQLGFWAAALRDHGADFLAGELAVLDELEHMIRDNARRHGPPVVTVGSDWGCYRDGDPYLVSGCGWYVDIIHSGQEMTRYCHMVSEPLVAVGDFVVAGQQLGQIGSTGNSSGPHLHFEVHVNADPRFGGPVDPEPWMSDHGAPLGQGSLL